MRKDIVRLPALIIIGISLVVPPLVQAVDDAELAQELTNPIADIMTIPIQMNFDNDIGSNDQGSKITTNIQPVIPFEANEDWNLITRTIFPVIYQDDVYPGSGSQFGLGDVLAQLFFSPKKPTSGGIIWGLEPLFDYQRQQIQNLEEKSGAPDQQGWPLPCADHGLWAHSPITSGRLQATVTVLTSTIRFSNPLLPIPGLMPGLPRYRVKAITIGKPSSGRSRLMSPASKLIRIGRLPVSLMGGVGYWLETPETGPEGWRFRLQANIVLPR